jgi:cytochrome c oxidase subunit 4
MSGQNTESHLNDNHAAESHVIGYGTYIMVWLGLVALTAVTVSVAGFEFGGVTIVIALLIATVKSLLVGNYFMHLKFEKAIFKVFIAVCIVIFLVMIILTFADLSFR